VVVDDAGKIYVVWADERHGPYGDGEIYFKKFDGIVWEPDVRLTNAPDNSWRPSVALKADGSLHVVWVDQRDGNYEVYYRMRHPGEVAGIDETDLVKVRPGTVRVLPNPARSGVQIRFLAAGEAETSIAIYDIAGRLVWRRDMGLLPPGQHRLNWPGTDRAGRPVASGIYFLSIRAGTRTSYAKIVVAR
jgi:hypothetical protein